MLRLIQAFIVGFLLTASAGAGGAAGIEPLVMAPFKVDPARPGIIELDGEITAGSALAFRRALNAAPDARLLVLDSPGGLVQMALLIADDVHQRRIATLVPAGAECMSACAYIFLAGPERRTDGKLGVHQISSDLPNLESVQMSISDILDLLNRFETPIEVLTVMFRTPPKEMHVFSAEEVARYGINRKAGVPSVPAAAPQPSVAAAGEPPPVASAPSVASLQPPAAPAPVLDGRTAAAVSAIEGYTKQTTRIALYAGLDFFGRDVASETVVDAPACASRCFELNGQCRAFTFNTKTPVSRGPNCFLKEGRGRADGNSAALSGELLARADRDPLPMTIGTIDPEIDLFNNVDLPGLDLSRRALAGVTTQNECRLACVESDQCVAFTFVRPKKECWLKGGIGTPRGMAGAITGAKKTRTFTPDTISLE